MNGQRLDNGMKRTFLNILVVFLVSSAILYFSPSTYTVSSLDFSSLSFSFLLPHEPIVIESDEDFLDYGFPGTGTTEDPFIIENLNITTSEEDGIRINSTSKHFIIRNCYIDSCENGIGIRFVSPGTTSVINNTCFNNSWHGIFMYLTDNALIANNTCAHNDRLGIFLNTCNNSIIKGNVLFDNFRGGLVMQDSLHPIIENNYIYDNHFYGGIRLLHTNNAEIRNNTFQFHYYNIQLVLSNNSIFADNLFITGVFSIIIVDSDTSTIFSNNFTHNHAGIYFLRSLNCAVINNSFYDNVCGMRISNSNSSTFSYNIIQNSTLYGVTLDSLSSSNLFHHNAFIGNNPEGFSQASDNGTDNTWSYKRKGNYWSDWLEGDYLIDGTAESADSHPLSEYLKYSTHKTSLDSFWGVIFSLFLFTVVTRVIILKRARLLVKSFNSET